MKAYLQLLSQGRLNYRLCWSYELVVHRVVLEELNAEEILAGGGIHEQLVHAPENGLQTRKYHHISSFDLPPLPAHSRAPP